MSCTTSAYFGSPRGLLSCCKTYPGSIDTVEVCGSSPHGPTIHPIESIERRPKPHPQFRATRHHWSPIAKGFRLLPADELGWEWYRPPRSWTSCCGLDVPARSAGGKQRWQWVSPTLSKPDIGKGPYQTVHIIGTRASGHPSWPGVDDSTKAEYISADQLPLFVFRLQLCGGPYIPIRGGSTYMEFDCGDKWMRMRFSCAGIRPSLARDSACPIGVASMITLKRILRQFARKMANLLERYREACQVDHL